MDERTTSKRVIAVVTDAFAPFHHSVVTMLRAQFSDAGFGTLVVTGRDVHTDRLIEQGGEQAYRTHLDVQGAIVICGATPPDMSKDEIAEYVAHLTDGPVVSLGIELSGVPSVTIGWSEVIPFVMQHAVETTPGSRFVFVRGFPGDPHSEMREAGFRTGLHAAGLEVDEELVVNGNYSVADAMNAVKNLLSSGLRFDAIVAANDDMAIGAIAALRDHGLSVPNDVTVLGFDDSVAAFTSEPPLTSVLLDTGRLTRATADLVLRAIERGQAPARGHLVTIESALVVRESTQRKVEKPLASAAHRLTVSSLASLIASQWHTRRAPATVDIAELATSAASTLLRGDSSFNLTGIRLMLHSHDGTSDDTMRWYRHVVRELRTIARGLPHDVTSDAGRHLMAEQLADFETRISEAETSLGAKRTAYQQLHERLVMRLAAVSDEDALWSTLRAGLTSLDVGSAWVAIEDQIDNNASGATMRLVFCLEEDVDRMDELFHRSSILPERFDATLEKGSHVLVPLRAGQNDIGYLIVEPTGEYLLDVEAIASGVAQVLRHVKQIRDLQRQTERLQLANQALDHLAKRDPLTGLPNRKAFMECLADSLGSATANEDIAILFLDLDDFKQVNDTLGHEAGDRLLNTIADRVNRELEPGDTLSRLGGDEFTIILTSQIGDRRTESVARRILRVVAEPCMIHGHQVSISASVGIANYPHDGVTTDELLRNADVAMYAAKAVGKNRHAFYGNLPQPHSTPSARQNFEHTAD